MQIYEKKITFSSDPTVKECDLLGAIGWGSSKFVSSLFASPFKSREAFVISATRSFDDNRIPTVERSFPIGMLLCWTFFSPKDECESTVYSKNKQTII